MSNPQKKQHNNIILTIYLNFIKNSIKESKLQNQEELLTMEYYIEFMINADGRSLICLIKNIKVIIMLLFFIETR